MNKLLGPVLPVLVVGGFVAISLAYPFEQALTESEIEFVELYTDSDASSNENALAEGSGVDQR